MLTPEEIAAKRKAIAEAVKPPRTAPMPADHPDSIKHWGDVVPEGDDTRTLSRLITSIYDHVRSVSKTPSTTAMPNDAYSYIYPSMMRLITELFQTSDFDLSLQESQKIGIAGRAALHTMYYSIFAIPYETVTPPGLGGVQMPIITRGAFRWWVFMRLVEDIDKVHRVINEMLADENRVFIDPVTEAPFKYLIPRSAWPKNGAFNNPQLEQELKDGKKMWMTERKKIIAEQLQISAIKEREKRDQANMRVYTSQQAAENSARLALANAELAAARMRARALRDGNQAQLSIFDEPGTRYVYRRSDEPGNF